MKKLVSVLVSIAVIYAGIAYAAMGGIGSLNMSTPATATPIASMTSVQPVGSFLMVWNGATGYKAVQAGMINGTVQMDWGSTGVSNIATNTTTASKAFTGILNTIVVNTAGTASTVALYNIASAGCTGTPGSGYVATLPTTSTGTIYQVNHGFSLGICAVTAGTGAANISLLYR